MEKRFKIALVVLLIAVLGLSGYAIKLNNKTKQLQAEKAQIEIQAQEQIDAFNMDTMSCEEEKEKNEAIKEGYFNMVHDLQYKFDSLSNVSKRRVQSLQREISELKVDNRELLAELEHEKELYADLTGTVEQLQNRIDVLNFNYQTAVATATKHAERKFKIEQSFLAQKEATKQQPFTFSDNVVEGTVTYDSTGVPNVALNYPHKIYRKGKYDMKVAPSVSLGMGMGQDIMNEQTYVGYGVQAGIAVSPQQKYKELGQKKSEIEVHILQKKAQYEKQNVLVNNTDNANDTTF